MFFREEDMKILALGGAGQEGARAVSDLAKSPQVEAVIIGDINLDAANRLKSSIGGTKATSVRVDATDHEQLVAALRDIDVVLSFVGPYFRFGVPILKAAIASGCNYVDICDDTEPTLEMLELSREAEAAGRLGELPTNHNPRFAPVIGSKRCRCSAARVHRGHRPCSSGTFARTTRTVCHRPTSIRC